VAALLRRRPLLSFYVLAFAWTWTFVIVFLNLFPIPDVIVRTTPGDLLTGDLFPAAKNNEVGPVVGFVIVALLIVFATRGRLGYAVAEARSVAPAYSTP
jgi:hypothetical protein